MSRMIDADVLIEILTTAIRNMQGVAKFIGAEDDPEIKMEIKAYSDILDGMKGQPTIEPERKKGKWIQALTKDQIGFNVVCFRCSECNDVEYVATPFCPNCGADMRGDQDEDNGI